MRTQLQMISMLILNTFGTDKGDIDGIFSRALMEVEDISWKPIVAENLAL